MGRSRSRGKSGRSKGQIGSVVIGLVIAAVLGLSSGEFQNDRNANDTQVESSQVESSNLEVHFIDVGQGDATLIKADGKYMLIDAGDNSKGTAVQSYLQKQGVKKLDYLVLTHTDADHIGGADVIVTKFDIGEIFLADYKKNNATYRDLMSAISYKRLTYSTPEVGSVYTLGNATFQIIAPVKKYDNPNDYSIGLILKHGENTFLFTGDAEGPAEADILKTGIDLDIDVYQAGHHGSRSSSDRDFLEAMTPEYAVISCKEDNSYGHPHAQTLNSLRAMKVKVFRTDEQGSIVAYSDGTEITWNCAPSETWQAGEPKGN
jgi:beta-lactamase superfamily II metal-dependent hydrolase